MTRVVAALILIACGTAHAEPAIDLAVEGRVDVGTGASAGIDLGVIGIGAELRPSSMVAIAAFGVVVGAEGMAHGAPGGELAITVMPFPSWPVRPYLRWSAGILIFPGAPFLPGGDGYDFMLHAGLGVEARVADRLTLAIHADDAHVSNGQGLGAFNPAFNGAGVGIDVAYALGAPNAPDPAISSPVATPAVIVEGAYGNANGWLATGRVRAAYPLLPELAAQIDVEAGALADHGLIEAGLDAVGTRDRFTLAVHGGYGDYAGIHTGSAQVQAQTRITDATSIVATGIWEPSSYIGSLAAGAGLRVMPLPSLAIDVGEGIEHPLGGATSFAPYFGGEWQLPFAPAWSLFYERQITGLNELGVRFTYGRLWRRLR